MAGTILKSNNAEIGVVTGTTVTLANSAGGSQDAFAAINIGAGNTFIVSSTSPLDGTYSYVATQAGANLLEVYMALGSVVADFSFQMEWVHQTPAVNFALLRTFSTTTLTGAVHNVFIRTDNKAHIFDNIAAAQSAASTGVLTPGSTYVMQYRSSGTTLTCYIYLKGSNTPVVSFPALTVGSSSVGSVRIGITAASALVTLKFDEVKLGQNGLLARTDVSNSAPTASVGPDQYVAVGSTVNLVGTDADTDGTVTGRAWTWDTTDTSGPASTTRKWATGPTISGATTQNATAVMATAGAYRAKYIVTDDGGATSTPAYTNIFVYPATTVAVGIRNAVKGAWTRTGGSDDTAVLNDANDVTGHTSAADPTGQADTLLMMPHGPGASAGAITFTLKGNSSGGPISRTVEWYKSDGTTLVDSQTANAPTTLGNQTFTMATSGGSGGLSAIPALADRAELVVKVKSTAI